MNQYERLQDEAISKNLKVRERPLRHHNGLIIDDTITIKSDMTTIEKTCILAEELAHAERTVGNILNLNNDNNVRQELKARALAYERLVPVENILFAIKDGHSEPWDMAEYLEVTEEFLLEAIEHYKRKAVKIFD